MTYSFRSPPSWLQNVLVNPRCPLPVAAGRGMYYGKEAVIQSSRPMLLVSTVTNIGCCSQGAPVDKAYSMRGEATAVHGTKSLRMPPLRMTWRLTMCRTLVLELYVASEIVANQGSSIVGRRTIGPRPVPHGLMMDDCVTLRNCR